eukprot:1157247-Pelagomonas_calceolata.AAC.18
MLQRVLCGCGLVGMSSGAASEDLQRHMDALGHLQAQAHDVPQPFTCSCALAGKQCVCKASFVILQMVSVLAKMCAGTFDAA